MLSPELGPVGGSVDEKVEFISVKITSLHRFGSFEGGIFRGGGDAYLWTR